MQIKVSIITATYNSAATVKSCLDSVSKQSYSHIEHLLIDGASSDDTLKILNLYAQNHFDIKVISEPDKGIYDALNKGVKMATGDVIGFLHSDDMLSSGDVIETIVAHFKHESLHGVFGDLKYVDFFNSKLTKRYWRSSNFSLSKLKNGWMPPHPTLFLRRELYMEYGLFNINFEIAADYDFILRIFKNPQLKFKYLPRVLVLMREGGASNKNFRNIVKKSREDYTALKTNNFPFPLWTLLGKNTQKLPQWIFK